MKVSIASVIVASTVVAVEGARHLHDTDVNGRNYNRESPDKNVRTDTKSMNHKRSGGAKPRSVEANLHENIQRILDGCNVRGASVAFYDRSIMNEPIVKGYGKISAEENAPGVTADTVFMIASVSKVFGGAAVMKLIEDGLIGSEQEDICWVLPEEYGIGACRHPNFQDDKVTWAHIMTHTSSMVGGIPDDGDSSPSYGPEGGYDGSAVGNEACPLEDVIGFYRDIMTRTDFEGDNYTEIGTDVDWFELAANAVDPDFEEDGAQGSVWLKGKKPGTINVYSNFATGYLAALVEHALWEDPQSFPDYCKEKIFDPAGMTNTAWFRRDLPDGVLEAVPTYWLDDHWEDVSLLDGADEKHYCFIDYTSGQLHTSAADLSKFMHALTNDYGSGVIYDNEANGRKTLTYLSDVSDHGFCWIVMSNEDKVDAEGYLELATDLDWTNAGTHSGGEEGVVTDMVVFPESGVYMVVLTNTSGNDDCDVTGDVMFELMEYRKAMGS